MEESVPTPTGDLLVALSDPRTQHKLSQLSFALLLEGDEMEVGNHEAKVRGSCWQLNRAGCSKRSEVTRWQLCRFYDYFWGTILLTFHDHICFGVYLHFCIGPSSLNMLGTFLSAVRSPPDCSSLPFEPWCIWWRLSEKVSSCCSCSSCCPENARGYIQHSSLLPIWLRRGWKILCQKLVGVSCPPEGALLPVHGTAACSSALCCLVPAAHPWEHGVPERKGTSLLQKLIVMDADVEKVCVASTIKASF